MPMYHERQKLMLCALHAVNNLLQRQQFTKDDFDMIAANLTLAHRTRTPQLLAKMSTHQIAFLGQYDVNVIEAALDTIDCDVRWHDRRTDVAELTAMLSGRRIVGAIANVKHGLFGKHWVALRRARPQSYPCVWYLHDSRLASPVLVGDNAEAAAVVGAWVGGYDAEVLLVHYRPCCTLFGKENVCESFDNRGTVAIMQ
eukprot:m51a1_g3994 hypothetical protein (199) ;mRNA; r:503537-504418